jgi:ribosomal protein S18 acetylase RimI-like enzyme
MKDQEIVFAVMRMADYPEVYALWDGMPGIGLSSADSPDAIARYLEHNPGMSFTARKSGRLLGAVLCGHDGRRGYLQHLAVAPDARHKGIGRGLVDRCLDALAADGITRCHIFVYTDNDTGLGFWRSVGWFRRDNLLIMTHDM